jgi:pimeloyl-ACP methyl ester carboxylesterase
MPALVAIAATLLGGCASTPDARELRSEPVRFRTTEGAPAVEDGRAEFRAVFCAELRRKGLVTSEDASCGRWLWRLPDEPVSRAADVGSSLSPPELALFIVTGAFSECVGDDARPFIVGADRLREEGAYVETIMVGGRSGTASNARQIAASIERAQVPGEHQLIVVGYSKGALDALRFLVDFPALAVQVDAVVSVAGPIYGSPLAEMAEAPYERLLARLPYDKCPPGDGEVIRSLDPAIATQWLASNPLPSNVRYYSIAGFTTREHMARALVPTWKILNRTDVRNDGQVVAADAVIPGSTLLGYANADHWGIAESIETVRTYLAARPDPIPFPLEPLLRAIARFVSDDIERAAGR